MNCKLVSILIPLYNSEKWIGDTIQSILSQSYSNIEVVIVDDGSTDKSFEIARSFASEKVKIFQQPNSGGCVARNKAFELSTGEYIVFFDADDLMYPDKIKNQMLLVDHFGDDFVYSSQWIPFTNEIPNNFLPKSIIDQDFDNPIEWLTTSWLNKSAQTGVWLTPRSIIYKTGGWDETLKVNQDGEYFFRVLLNSKGVKFSNDSYTFYRRNVTTSISEKYIPERAASMLQSYISFEKILDLENTDIVKKALATNYAMFIYIYYKEEKDLINIAWERLEKLGINVNWEIGGKMFQFLSKLVGFKNALILKNIF